MNASSSLRILFMGTPQFAVPSLEALMSSRHTVAAVVTKPDARKGRGLVVAESPVKVCAKADAVPVLQPENLKDPAFLSGLRELQIDLIVIVAFRILPGEVLAIPRLGAVNLHPSLLPKYRGAAPIPWTLAHGDTETGITVFFLNQVVDGGDIIEQTHEPIECRETAGELSRRLSEKGAGLLVSCVDRIADNRVVPLRQNDTLATPAPKLKKEDGRIDFTQPVKVIYNRIRGFTPAPGAFTMYKGKRLQVLRCEPGVGPGGKPAGTVLAVGPEGLWVQTGEGVLKILTVKPENRQEMAIRDFANGSHIHENEILGL